MKRALLIFFLAAGCGTTPAGPRIEHREPRVDSLRIEFEKQELVALTPVLYAVLRNPTATAVKATRITYEVQVEGAPTTRGELALDATAPPGSEVPLTLQAKAVTIATSAEEIVRLADKRALEVLFQGMVTLVGEDGKTREVPFSRAAQARTPRLPVISMQQVQISRAGEEIAITFSVGVDNPNPFEVPVAGLTCSLTVGGKIMSEPRTTARNDKLPRSASAVYDLPRIPLTLESFGPELPARVKAGDLDYAVSGELDLGTIKLPVQLTGPVPISK